MHKKRMDIKYKLLIIVLILVIFIAFIIYIMKKEKNLNPVEKVIKDACLTVSSVFYKPVNFVQNIIKENNEKTRIYKEYKELEEKREKMNANEALIDELKKENNELKKLLELNNTLVEYDKINATVINRNIGYWYNTITIDKGQASGITKDMAVVTNSGLIGKVINTSYLYSTVRLLTSDELGQKVSVKIKVTDDKYVYGLLSSYDTKEKTFVIEGISENVELLEGMTVTTTGMSNIFPSGILIGTIKGIKKDNFDLTMLALVTPSNDFEDISFVSVLKRKSESVWVLISS